MVIIHEQYRVPGLRFYDWVVCVKHKGFDVKAFVAGPLSDHSLAIVADYLRTVIEKADAAILRL